MTSNRNNDKPCLSWSQVCQLLGKIESSSRLKKREVLQSFFSHFKKCVSSDVKNHDSTFLPILRILLPNLDRERGAYGFKEKKLAELYIRVLAIKKDSVDAKKLKYYRNYLQSEVHDFAEVAYCTLRNYCPLSGSISLEEIDKCLSIIAKNHISKGNDSNEQVLSRLLRVMTAYEQKWFIRVLLKDMRLGISQICVFTCWHPDAKEYYSVTNSLSRVCSVLRDPTVRLNEIEISVFSPFRPMLAERAILHKIEFMLNGKTFCSETKFDGERSQLHKKGNSYKYFSRNGFDFSSNFGVSSSVGLFTPRVHSLFPKWVHEVILDGEMIGWDRKLNAFATKGQNIDVKHLREESDLQVCFCVFDIVLLNGKILTNLPLRERRKYLSKVISPLKGRLFVVPQTEVLCKDDVISQINTAMGKGEEGIVLKNMDSNYVPASRTDGWMKLKPDYCTNFVRDLDLLIVGGFYGSGQRRQIFSQFLLAVAEPPLKDSSLPNRFYSICHVVSGFSISELGNLTAKLSNCKEHQCPPCVLAVKEKPDVWFTPEKSVVVQVNAAEIVKSHSYTAGFTLRFPRVEKIRFDKQWFEVLTLANIRELVSSKAMRNYVTCSDGNETGQKRSHRRKNAPSVSLPKYLKPHDSSISQKNDIFKGKEFCVASENVTKINLESLIIERGGSISQHPGKTTHCVVCDKPSVRVRNVIHSGLYNVVKSSWITSCVDEERFLPWNPNDIFFLKPEYEAIMKRDFDQYGDSLYSNVTDDSLKKIMSLMNIGSNMTQLEKEESIHELVPLYRGNIFRGIKAFFTEDGSCEDKNSVLIRLKFRLYGGTVCSDSGAETSHIVLTSKITWLSTPKPKDKAVLTEECIIESIEERKLCNSFVPKKSLEK